MIAELVDQDRAVRFGEAPTDRLGIVEDRGLAAAIAAEQGLPVWAPADPGDFGRLVLPDSVTLVLIGWDRSSGIPGMARAADARDAYRGADGRRWAVTVPASVLAHCLTWSAPLAARWPRSRLDSVFWWKGD
ncbi:MAG: hypothetical protein ACRC67_18180 [Inquilinus sp.]|uniref:hypothetical protein n=1 Tax=Inquilinus sp. TaxID=1932117 RepID=UPI003F39315E